MTNKNLTQAELKEQVIYDTNTGDFFWKITKKGVKIGNKIGSKTKDGYIRIMLNYQEYKAHRLAWLYMVGNFPKEFIDHANGIKTDNRFCNLRESTNMQNQQNVGLVISNTSGYKGISKNKSDGKWRAQCRVGKVKKHLGTFDTPELASSAYVEFAKQLHGEFYHG